ncbi:MAG: GNAT family N-acetyltransferase [Actinomycetes bacterium]
MTINVRPAEPGDAARIVELARAVCGEPERWLLAGERWRSVADERRYIRALRRHPGATLIVAADDEQIVGRLSLSRDPHPASRHVADLGLMVAASHRRRGIATALLQTAERWAQGAGVTKLELHVFPHNDAAIALYEKVGYIREGLRRSQYRRQNGEHVDALLMAKLLPTV